jgi:hypothetical protein
MERYMEWVLVSLMWLFFTIIVFASASIAVAFVWFVYLVSKIFRDDDPYTFEDRGDP